MPETTGGVRDHLANERTQLAWLRTGANVVVVGLGVARFGHGGDPSGASILAGAVLVLAGVVTVVSGTLRYRRIAAELREGTAATASSTAGPTRVAVVFLVATLVAGVVLLLAG